MPKCVKRDALAEQDMSRPKASLLKDRGIVGIDGEEARSFLQGLVTNNVEEVSKGRAVYAALLTPQGKYLFDFFIATSGDRLFLDCDASRVADLIKRLNFYKLRAKITIQNLSGAYNVVAFWEGENFSLPEGSTLFPDPRLAELGHRAILPSDTFHPALAKSEAVVVDAENYHRHRIALGIGETQDFEPERSFPLELNFDELNGVDFKKGCFIGQEVTSRVKRRGSVRKRLVPCHVEGALPAPGTSVTAEGREVGTIFSGDAATGMVLALLRLDLIKESSLIAGDARLTPQIPSWLTQSALEAEHGTGE